MSGHIRQRSPGSWELRYPLPPALDGKRRIRTETFRGSPREAQRLLIQRIAEIDNGTAVTPPAKMTLGDWLTRWLPGHNCKPITRERYASMVRCHIGPALGHIPLRDLSPAAIRAVFQAWAAAGRLKPSSLGQIRIVLSAALSAAVADDLLAKSPLDKLRGRLPVGEPPEAKVLDSDDVAALLERARGSEYHIALPLCATLGLRRGEALGLRWRNVDLAAATVTIAETITPLAGGNVWGGTKTGKSRTLALPRLATDELQRHRVAMAEHLLGLGVRLDGNHTVAMNAVGGPILPDTLTRWCGKHFGKLHMLRHSHASALLNAGVSIKTVADRLGHQRATTTLLTYSHTMPGSDKAAAEKIDELLSGSRTVANQR